MRSVRSKDRDLSAMDYPYVFLDATYCVSRPSHLHKYAIQ